MNKHHNKNKFIDQLKREELYVVLNTLYNGHPDVAFWLCQIRAFYAKKKDITREHRVYLWLVRNGLIGQKLCNFFLENDGFINGLNVIINNIEGRRFTKENIKIDEAF